ncbi:MAG: 2-C-methyl-D-erythritol 2,4-cyclodiphosphate synthase [Actinomycetes bacterium]
MSFRIGHGFDLHRFSDDPDRVLILGGITIPSHRGLIGHSDADAICHAICDALLSAAQLGDLGSHFPDTDPKWSGVASTLLLSEVVSLVHATGWSIANCAVTVMAETPKMKHHRAAMQELLEAVTGSPVSISATTMEKLGPIGEGLCLAAEAVALLEKDSR